MEKVKIKSSSTVFAILMILGIIVAYQARYIILISFVGIGLGVLFVPILSFFRNKIHLPKFLSALMVFLGILILFSAVSGSIYFLVSDQVSSLTQRWPTITSGVEEWLVDIDTKYPWLEEQFQKFEASNAIRNSLMKVFKGFQAGIVAVSGLVFALVIGLYTAVGGKEYYKSLVEAFPQQKREKAA